MTYYLTKFFRYVPVVDGMKVITSFDNFHAVSFETNLAVNTVSAMDAFPDQNIAKKIPLIELTENEALSASKFYTETRGYRSAYSDLENLEPDADSLAKGKRKTKVYLTNADFNGYDATADLISLKKKALKLHLDQEMEDRQLSLLNLDNTPRPEYDAETHAEIHTLVDSLSTIDDLMKHREEVFGHEMTKDLASRLGLWDSTRNARLSAVEFGYKF
jgi:hypothetical protein